MDTRPRITVLDALRGVGVLGILPVHIQIFSMVMAARFHPDLGGDLKGANRWFWIATALLADGKFISVFAMLFGAGLLLLVDRRAAGPVPVAGLHYRRMAALFLLGLAHAYLLWYGDMLVTFSLCGALVFSFRDLPPSRLLAAGAAALILASVISLSIGWSLPWWSAAVKAQLAETWAPRPAEIAREIALYQGGWAGQLAHRAPAAFRLETSQFAARGLWQTGGLMLLGMGLFKLGILSGMRSARFYALMTGLGFGVGLPLAWSGIARGVASHWDFADFMLARSHLVYWGDLFVGLGWIGLVTLLVRLGWRVGAVAAVGRTALSNYLFQTVVCTSIFYGHGLGLFARVDRVGQFLIVLGIWTLQLVGSTWVTRHFDAGPVEWLWRSATYGSKPRPALSRPGEPDGYGKVTCPQLQTPLELAAEDPAWPNAGAGDDRARPEGLDRMAKPPASL